MTSHELLGPGSDPEIAQVAKDVLCRAFLEDPFMAWMFPETATRAEGVGRWFDFWIEFYGDQGIYTVAPDGAAIWAKPDAREFDEEWGVKFFGIFTGETPERVDTLVNGLNAIEVLPKPPGSWYLNALAVEPQGRGKGTGKVLMAPTLELIDADGAPAYLDSSNHVNESFYTRLGFYASDKVTLLGSDERVQRMVRDSKPV